MVKIVRLSCSIDGQATVPEQLENYDKGLSNRPAGQ
jgi:hypothetical protein